MSTRKWNLLERVEAKDRTLYVIESKSTPHLRAVTSDPTFFVQNSRVLASDPQKLYHWYQHALMTPFVFTQARSVLSVGVAAGTLLTACKEVCQYVTGLENSPEMLQIAERWFDFKLALDVVVSNVEDASYAVSPFDVIQVDITSAYPHNEYLISEQQFKKYKSWLSHKGVLAFNMIVHPTIFNKMFARLNKIFRGRVLLLTPNAYERVLLCFNNSLELPMEFISKRIQTLEDKGFLVSDVLTPVLFDENYYADTFSTS